MPSRPDLSRLDWMLARLEAQKKTLELAAALVVDVPGPIYEIGLGKGRTWSHLKALFPDRPVVAFDRELHAPAAATPDLDDIRIGEFAKTLPATHAEAPVALIHADFGSEDERVDQETAALLSEILPDFLAPMGIIATDRHLNSRKIDKIPFETGDFPYFLYRRRAS